MKCQAAVFCGAHKPFEIQEYEVAAPSTGSVGLKLVCSGVCGTDVHIHGGFLAMPHFPLILGHEFIGRIDALGEGAVKDALGQTLAVGDTAVACVAIPCGKCFNCRRGETASCLSFGVTYAKDVKDAPHFHGGFAEYLYSPAQNLIKIPAGVDPLAAAAFPCGGPTILRSCAYGGGIEAGEIVVVQGNGSLGLFALAYAKARGCTVVVIGSTANPARVAACEALKADRFIDFRKASTEDIQAQIKEMAAAAGRGNGADVVIETSGAQDAFPLGLSLLRTRGRYFVPGQYSNRGPVSIEPQQITFRALQIIGSGQYTMADLGAYLDFLKANPALQPLFRSLVATYLVAEVNTAVADAASGKAIKAVFVPRS